MTKLRVQGIVNRFSMIQSAAAGASRWSTARTPFTTAASYPEEVQALTIKSAAFYDSEAAERRYFYYVDLQGRLFLENTLPKTIATSLKSPAMLRFFYERLQGNTSAVHAGYPWISKCGNETNFVKAADTPLVCESLEEDGSLVFGGGTMKAAFDPASVYLCATTGRLYHPVSTKRLRFRALLSSDVAIRLGAHIHVEEEGIPALEWAGAYYPLQTLGTS